MLVAIFFSLLACHWLADFTYLSRPYMLAAKANGTPLLPIWTHACVHAILMFIVLLFFTGKSTAFILMGWQSATHFVIDVLKGRLNVWFPNLRDTKSYGHWMVFGADQMLHVSIIFIMALLASINIYG